MNKLDSFKAQIELLSNIDFSQNWLTPDEQFVHAEPRTKGRFKQLEGERIFFNQQCSIEKITKILQANPEILKNPQTVEQLVHFKKNFPTISHWPNCFSQTLYELIEKLRNFIIISALKWDVNIFKGISSEETIREIRNLQLKGTRINEEKNQSFLPNISLTESDNLLQSYPVGTYFYTKKDSSNQFILRFLSPMKAVQSVNFYWDSENLRYEYKISETSSIYGATLFYFIKMLQQNEILPLALIPIKKAQRKDVSMSVEQEVEGLKVHQLIKQQGAQVVGIQESSKNNTFKWEQEVYNSDLEQALESNELILSLNWRDKKNFNMSDKLNVITDVACSLDLMHQAGYVHAHVNPTEILVKVDDEGKIKGFLKGVERASRIGNTGDQNYFIPFRDIFDLGMILGPLFFENFNQLRQSYCNDPDYLFNYLHKMMIERFAVQISHYGQSDLAQWWNHVCNGTTHFEEVKKAISQVRNRNASTGILSPKSLQILADLEQAFSMHLYIADLIKTKEEITHFLENNLEIKELLNTSENKDRLKAIEEIERRFPICKTSYFFNVLNKAKINFTNPESIMRGVTKRKREDEADNQLAFRRFSQEEINYLLPFFEEGTYVVSPGDSGRGECVLSCRVGEKDILTLSLLQQIPDEYVFSDEYLLISGSLEDLLLQLKANNVIPYDLKMTPIGVASPKRNEEKAATVIQKIFRGNKTRESVVLPHQILPFLQKQLIDKRNIEVIAQGLCKEINLITQNPQKYLGKRVNIEKYSEKYSIAIIKNILQEKRKSFETFQSSSDECYPQFACSLQMSKDGSKVKILIIVIEKCLAGIGAFKAVEKAQKFIIPLRSKENSREISYEEKALIHVDSDAIGVVKDGFGRLKEIIDLSTGAKVMTLPNAVLPLIPASESDVEYFTQKWYNSNLYKIILHSKIPLDFGPNPQYKLVSIFDKLNILKEVVRSLNLIHKAGYVHRDIKPLNIFVKVGKNGEIKPYLGDFDLVCPIGTTEQRFRIPYQDIYQSSFILASMLNPKTTCIFDEIYSIAEEDQENDNQENDSNDNVEMTENKRDVPSLDSIIINEVREKINVSTQTDLISFWLNLEQVHSYDDLSKEISTYLFENKETLSLESQNLLLSLSREIVATKEVCEFVSDLYNKGNLIVDYIKQHEEIKTMLNSSVKEDQIRAVEIIDERFKCSASDLLGLIERVEKILTQKKL